MSILPSSSRARGAALALALSLACRLEGATARVAGFFADNHLTGQGSVTSLEFARDGTLFWTEKNGTIKVLPYGAGSPKTFATLSVYTNSECGLLGLALDPDYPGFASGGDLYVFATVSASEQRIIKFRDVDGRGERQTPDVKVGLPTLGQNHDGGCLRIGPDRKLYAAIGDGGSGASKAQDLKVLFGKVLRLNLDGSIPDDNPDLSAIDPNYRREIFAYGFRNPFRIAIRKGAGPDGFQVWVDDVGSSGNKRREEVNLVLPGRNYGWPNVEGLTTAAQYQSPVHAYDYNPSGSSVVGGVFYQGSLFPAEYRDNYFYMDYVSNDVFRMVLDGDQMQSNTVFVDGAGGLIDIAEGPDGALYYGTGSGLIVRIRYEAPGNEKPVAALTAGPSSGPSPLEVALDATGSSDSDGSIVRYDWAFGDSSSFLDGGSTPSHVYEKEGRYTARVTVTDSSGGSASATALIEVIANDLPPQVEILAPAEGSTYDAGAVVEVSGKAIDPEDGELAGDRLSWDVILHHADHTHPWVTGQKGSTGSFTIPTEGIEESWSFLIRLTGTDAGGHDVTVERSVGLNYLPVALEGAPAGLRVTADGVSLATPAVYQAVNGATIELGAPSPQAVGPGLHRFLRWSDAGAATHTVTVSAGLTFSAFFEPDPRALFVRGDVNRDNSLDISDAVFTLAALFIGGRAWTCPDAADSNDDGTVNIADPVAVLSSLFTGRGPLPEPTLQPGFDPTSDPLRCEEPSGM